MTVGVCRAEVPQLFKQEKFDAAILAQAVNHFVEIGEEAAAREMTDLAPDDNDGPRSVNRAERVAWVCRILFEPRGREPLDPAPYGMQMFPYKDNRTVLKSWPLFPVACSGRSFFVLAEGYLYRGPPRDPKLYLAYCRAKGVFRKIPIPIPTRDEAMTDVAALKESPAWKALDWKGHSSEKRQWTFIQAQADSINETSGM